MEATTETLATGLEHRVEVGRSEIRESEAEAPA